MRQELIDFAEWFRENQFTIKYPNIEQLVDIYLSINDNAPTESRAINENEDEKKFCGSCKHFIETCPEDFTSSNGTICNDYEAK